MTSLLMSLKVFPFVILLFLANIYHRPDRSLKGSNLPIDNKLGRWEQAAPLPSTRYVSAGAIHDGKIYVVGGVFLPSVWFPTSLAEVYDPETNSWRRIKSYPRPLHHSAATSCAGKLYVVGGNGIRIQPLSDVYAYDSQNDIWEKKADLPVARGALGLTCFNGRIYAVGGGINKKQTGLVHEYNPETDTWSQKAPLPTPREHLTAVAAGGKIFALGGYTGSRLNALNDNEIYDPKSNTWKKGEPVPYSISGFGAAVLDGSIFIFGGEQAWAVSGEVHEYLVNEDRWVRRSNMPSARYESVTAPYGEGIHFIGGSDMLMGTNFSHDHDIFLPNAHPQ